MATCSAIGFKSQKEEVFIYVHYEGYPDGVGAEYYQFCRLLAKRRNEILPLFLNQYPMGFSTFLDFVTPFPTGAVVLDSKGVILNNLSKGLNSRGWYVNIPHLRQDGHYKLNDNYCMPFYYSPDEGDWRCNLEEAQASRYLDYIYYHDAELNKFVAWDRYTNNKIILPYNRRNYFRFTSNSLFDK